MGGNERLPSSVVVRRNGKSGNNTGFSGTIIFSDFFDGLAFFPAL